MDDLQIDQFISFNTNHVKLVDINCFQINQTRKKMQFERISLIVQQVNKNKIQTSKPKEIQQSQNNFKKIQETLVQESKKNGNFGPTAKNALIEVKKQNQLTNNFINKFIKPSEEKEGQNQQQGQIYKDINFQMISINQNFRTNTQAQPDHINLPLNNQPFIQIIDVQEYFPLWLRSYYLEAVDKKFNVFTFNNTEGLQNYFPMLDNSTKQLLNSFLLPREPLAIPLTHANIDKLQQLDDTLSYIHNNKILDQETFISFSIDEQSFNIARSINNKILQDIQFSAQYFAQILPLANQKSNEINLDQTHLELDTYYWQQLLTLNHHQMLNTIVFFSNAELKQIKFNIEQPIFNHTRFKKILIRNLLDPIEQNDQLPIGYNQIEISEPLQRLFRTTKTKYQSTTLFKLITGDKIELEQIFSLTDKEFQYYIKSFELLINITAQIDQYWELISGLNFGLEKKLRNSLNKLQQQVNQQLIILNKKSLKDSIQYNKTKEKYIVNNITEFYRRQIHSVIISNIPLQVRQSQSHLEFLSFSYLINGQQFSHTNVHLNMQIGNQWKTLENILNLEPSTFQGDFNISTLHNQQSNPQKKGILKKLFSNYCSTIRTDTKGKQQLDYSFISKKQLFSIKDLNYFKFNDRILTRDHYSIFNSATINTNTYQEQVEKNLTQLILNNPLLQYTEAQLEQPSKQQQFNSIILKQDLNRIDYINPPNIMKWKKQIDIDQWNLSLKHEVDQNQFKLNPIVQEEIVKLKKGDGKYNSQNYQIATKHDAEDLGREVQRISNQEQEDNKINNIVYQQFNKEFNQEQFYNNITINNERKYKNKNNPFQYTGRYLQSNPLIMNTDIEVETDTVCSLDKLSYVNPTKATGRNSIPCSFMTLLTKIHNGRIIIQSRIFNYYNNILQYRNRKNKIRATQYLIKKQQGNFFKLRGLEIPNIEQKIFGNAQTNIPKPTTNENIRYQFAYEKDTGTQKAMENFVNFIQKALSDDQEIVILVLDAEGGFNRSDKANAIQAMNNILRFNNTRRDIISTIGNAQIEEMNQPIGTSRQYPFKNVMFQTNGVPQGSSTSPETYCISIDQGIKDFITWQEDKKDIDYINKLVNAYMDDLILVYTMRKDNEFWNKDYNKITNQWIDKLQLCIKNYNPGYEINIAKTEKIAIRTQQQFMKYQYQFRSAQKDEKTQNETELITNGMIFQIDKPFKYLGLHFNFGNKYFINEDIKIFLDKIDKYQKRNILTNKLIKKGARSKMKTITFDQYFMGNLNYRSQFIPYSSNPFQQLIRRQALQWQLGQQKNYISMGYQYLINFKDPIESLRKLQSQPSPILSEPFQEFKFNNNIKENLKSGNNINIYQNLFYEIETRDRQTDINTKMKINGIQQKMLFPQATLTTQRNQQFSENYKNLPEQKELNEQQRKNLIIWKELFINQILTIQIYM